ncbi:hypothetical protein FRZ03_35230 [Streptomyces misionensis]|uniref:Uncharacterized protein n=1 Tax=Streptomyces misionensis TaxID=67331 RepID=A0A5C6ISH5_9ACTN|nr:hypothetical protein [Streptomyces misionensis]TWV31217.1 hypothetical protein FRZ03_35230 [Streptomyces misionensis]
MRRTQAPGRPPADRPPRPRAGGRDPGGPPAGTTGTPPAPVPGAHGGTGPARTCGRPEADR